MVGERGRGSKFSFNDPVVSEYSLLLLPYFPAFFSCIFMLGFSPPRRAPRPVRIERERECGIWWHEWFSFIPPAILPHPPIRAAQRGGSHTEQTERSRGEAAAKGSRDTHLASCDWAQLISEQARDDYNNTFNAVIGDRCRRGVPVSRSSN